MAKNDSVDNQEYDVVYDEDQKKGLFSNTKKANKKKKSTPAVKFSEVDN